MNFVKLKYLWYRFKSAARLFFLIYWIIRLSNLYFKNHQILIFTNELKNGQKTCWFPVRALSCTHMFIVYVCTFYHDLYFKLICIHCRYAVLAQGLCLWELRQCQTKPNTALCVIRLWHVCDSCSTLLSTSHYTLGSPRVQILLCGDVEPCYQVPLKIV